MAELLTCQPIFGDLFSAANRLRCEKYVRRMQRRLDKAVASGNKEKIRFITHLLTRRSEAVKILSTYRITSNSGSQTAGIDGIAIPKGANKTRIRKRLLRQIDTTLKPSPIRRVYIPKENGKRRPLGIATLTDRIIQDVVKTAIEPIAEYHFSHQSFGFRPKRRAMDAIDKIFKKMARTNAPVWVIEGDISSCFDHISHNHLNNTMMEWQIPKSIRRFTQRTLKTRIFELGRYTQNEEGTQQGGPLSPMLANIALTGLDRFCETVGNNKKSVKWILAKYNTKKGDRFTKEGMSNAKFLDVPIQRYTSLRDGVRIHDGNLKTQTFWKKREYINALDQIYSVRMEKLIKRQKGICPTCNESMTAEQIKARQVHAHHRVPRSENGDDQLSNLTLLHSDCHQLIHSVFSRSQMEQLYQRRLKYYGKRAINEAVGLRQS